jgi:predicted Rossmann fold nucleotide-binding protein DprA/Smf involved in DNA uptake
MKKLKQDLTAVNKELKALVKKTESLMKAADRIEKAQAAKPKKASPKKAIKPKTVKKVAAQKTPARKKTSNLTDTDKFLNIIKRSKKGVTTQTLMKKTGFDAKKIANMVFRATKMGKIKSVSKGVYVGA